jgi:ElaB/YqjD/DUF883 family membrane-anchored ribosome-binding protein
MNNEWSYAMADDLRGTVRKVGTVIEDSAGRAADNTKVAAEGLVNQAVDVVQDNYGKAVDAAKDGVEAAKDAAVASHDFLRKFMEDNPHTTTALALGVGLLVGAAVTRRS